MPNADDQQLTFKSTTRPRRIVVGTGTVYASRVISVLRAMGIETRLVIGKRALATLKYESSMTEEQVRRWGDFNYTTKKLSAPIASGSFQHDGMVGFELLTD